MPDSKEQVSVLVVDDETSMQELFAEILVGSGYQVTEATTAAEAKAALAEADFDLAILDRKLPDGDGVALLGELRAAGQHLPALVVTGFPSVPTAIEALGNYACDYLCKPFAPDELLAKVKQVTEASTVVCDNAYLWQALRTRFGFDNVLSRDAVVGGCYVAAAKVAYSDVSVLIQGETGSGKEYLARAIHYMSDRNDRAFVPVNCGAIPETLLESELFGHEKGAFTSATSRKPGLCEEADKGTLFLDEISQMSMDMQVKLLRFVQDGHFTRLGGVKASEVNVRVIAATNSNLQQAVKVGKFREDLYYRLNVVPLYLPPLRERLEDIMLFAEHFLKRHAHEGSASSYSISPAARLALQRYEWPGNLRELENVMRRALLIAGSGTIEAHHLMLGASASAPDYLQALKNGSGGPDRTHGQREGMAAAEAGPGEDPGALVGLEQIEKAHIERVLVAVDNNKTRAAEILGIARKTLRSKMRKYDIPDRVVAPGEAVAAPAA